LLAAQEPGMTIGLVPCAFGGTSLSQWEPKSKNLLYPPDNLYQNAIRRAKIAMQTGTLAGILWHQGESDEANAEYLPALKQLIADLRADLGDPDLPFVAGEIHEVKLINDQLARLPREVPHTAVVSADGLKAQDRWHFNSAGIRLLGERYAMAMQRTRSLRRISFPDDSLTVSGLPWFTEDKPLLSRLPARLKATLPRERLWAIAQQPSGVRIRFRTDSRRVCIVAQVADASVMEHITSIGQNGFDLYADNEYLASAYPGVVQGSPTKIDTTWATGIERAMRDVTIYLPLYKAATIDAIYVDADAKIEAPGPFAVTKPVVYYGTSITQGGCASNPGDSYPAMLSRWMNVDFVNLGFDGNGLGDDAIASAMAEIDAAAFVLDYWVNVVPDQLHDTLPRMVDALRAKHPQTPIFVTSPYFNTRAVVNDTSAKQDAQKLKVAREFVEARRAKGDQQIEFIDGREMISRDQAIGLVDGLHANTLGFYFCAKGLEPHLRRALALPPKAAPEISHEAQQ
jgi:hypothetical protein